METPFEHRIAVEDDLLDGPLRSGGPAVPPERTAASEADASDAASVGPGGLEPPTSPLSGVRSNQLSYEPDLPGRSRAGQCSEPPSEGKWADIVTRP